MPIPRSGSPRMTKAQEHVRRIYAGCDCPHRGSRGSSRTRATMQSHATACRLTDPHPVIRGLDLSPRRASQRLRQRLRPQLQIEDPSARVPRDDPR